MPNFHIHLLLLPLLLTGCHSAPKKTTPPPRPTITTVKPASITIDPATNWSAAPTNGGMPLFTDDNDSTITFFPTALRGTLIIQRATTDTGYLNGKVTVPTDALLYAAFAAQRNDDRLISDPQFAALAKEGWTRVPGIFQISEPITQHTLFQIWSHPVPPGPVTLTSESLPNPTTLFLGRPH